MITHIFVLIIYLSFLIDFIFWPVSSEASTKNLILNNQNVNNSIKLLYFLIFSVNFIFTLAPVVISIYHISADVTTKTGFQEIFGMSLILTGRFLSLSASRTLNINNGSKLLRHSIFRISRNPISFGLILTFLGLSILYFHPLLMTGWFIFTINLNYKINIEEKHLVQKFGKEYQDYRNSTPKYFLL